MSDDYRTDWASVPCNDHGVVVDLAATNLTEPLGLPQILVQPPFMPSSHLDTTARPINHSSPSLYGPTHQEANFIPTRQEEYPPVAVTYNPPPPQVPTHLPTTPLSGCNDYQPPTIQYQYAPYPDTNPQHVIRSPSWSANMPVGVQSPIMSPYIYGPEASHVVAMNEGMAQSPYRLSHQYPVTPPAHTSSSSPRYSATTYIMDPLALYNTSLHPFATINAPFTTPSSSYWSMPQTSPPVFNNVLPSPALTQRTSVQPSPRQFLQPLSPQCHTSSSAIAASPISVCASLSTQPTPGYSCPAHPEVELKTLKDLQRHLCNLKDHPDDAPRIRCPVRECTGKAGVTGLSYCLFDCIRHLKDFHKWDKKDAKSFANLNNDDFLNSLFCKDGRPVDLLWLPRGNSRRIQLQFLQGAKFML